MKKRCLEVLSLLTHVNYELNIQRRFLMKPEFCSLCSPVVPFTDYLFVDDLQKHLKDIGDENKIGAKLQRGTKANYSPASGTSFGKASYNQNRPRNQRSRGLQYPSKKYPHKGRQSRAPNKRQMSSQTVNHSVVSNHVTCFMAGNFKILKWRHSSLPLPLSNQVHTWQSLT